MKILYEEGDTVWVPEVGTQTGFQHIHINDAMVVQVKKSIFESEKRQILKLEFSDGAIEDSIFNDQVYPSKQAAAKAVVKMVSSHLTKKYREIEDA